MQPTYTGCEARLTHLTSALQRGNQCQLVVGRYSGSRLTFKSTLGITKTDVSLKSPRAIITDSRTAIIANSKCRDIGGKRVDG
ncbi:hypothetical protein J6590_011417 [Homalodisca vitripennis]|nr:hypothetical protein J6590_011417 [Homalodisca vitripennis]